MKIYILFYHDFETNNKNVIATTDDYNLIVLIKNNYYKDEHDEKICMQLIIEQYDLNSIENMYINNFKDAHIN